MLIRKIFAVFSLLTGFILSVNSETLYHTLPLEQKVKEKNLLFLATFDNYNVNADFAKGYKKALTCPDISLLLRGILGFDGKAAYKVNPDEELVYSVKNNLLPEQGTLSVWVKLDQFDPADQTIVNAGVYRIFVRNGESWTENMAYITKGVLYFCNHCGNGMMPDFGSFGTNVSLKGIKKDEWFLVTTAWNETSATFYLNGKKIATGTAPKPLTPGPGSFFGFSTRIWWQTGLDTRQHPLTFDDIKVYNVCMSDLQVAKMYNDMLRNPKAMPELLKVSVSGKENPSGKVPFMRVHADARAVTDATVIEYDVKGEAFARKGSSELKNGMAELLFDIPASGGKYDIEIKCGSYTKKIVFQAPDCSFALEEEDELTIPYPWTAPQWNEKERSVTLWNRKYVFGSSPFPQKVLVAGKAVLSEPPALHLDGAPVKWSFKKAEKTPLGFKLYGSGQCGKIKFDYISLVEYDGMIKVDFDLKAQNSTISSMNVAWKVKPEHCKYLMTPRYYHGVSDVLKFGLPSYAFRAHFMLWLASEKAGFCWMPENDANWVLKNPTEAISVNRKTGSCSVSMISKKTVFNGSYHYSMFFTATPTRSPMWSPEADFRATESLKILSPYGSKIYLSMNHDDVMMKNYAGVYRDKTVVPYNTAHAQIADNPLAAYMHQYWDLPGCFVYPMYNSSPDYTTGRYKYNHSKTLNVCVQNTLFTKYVTVNLKKAMASEYSRKFRMLYFDLGSVNVCRNQEHGCGFRDRFGKNVATFNVMGLRRFYQNMLQIARQYNIPVMTHGQDCVVPMINGIGDYWFPGEQFQAWTGNDQAGYTDKVPVELYRTETNRDILGCNVIFLPEVPQNVPISFRFNANEAMMTMLLAHDIDWSELIEQTVPRKVKEILQHYKLNDSSVKAHLYYQQKTITSSDSRIWVTWYDCPDQYKLMILANPTPEKISTTIDLSKMNLNAGSLTDEYSNKTYPLNNSRLNITMKPRSFAIIGLPGKAWYPIRDGFEKCWLQYMYHNVHTPYGDLGPRNEWDDEGVYRTEAPSMVIPFRSPTFLEYVNRKLPAHWNSYFVRQIPVKVNAEYELSIYGRTRGLPENGEVQFRIQPMKDLMSKNGDPLILKLKNPNQEDWEKLSARVKVAPGTTFLQIELESVNAGKAKVWFDDFSAEEITK